MSCQADDIALIKKAQLGDRDGLDHLAEMAKVRLHEYVLRLTLNEDLTQDIVQETILEMLQIFKKLRKAEAFWPWLYSIALNKTRNHYGKRWRRRTRNFSETNYEPEVTTGDDTLSDVVTAELRQIVLQSVSQLAPRHRAVLSMRCYDHLSYAQIAQLMGCSEIGARAAFCRAKKCLARHLAAYGLGKGSLVLALVAFGKITATSKASAAQVAVTGAMLQVGSKAALVAGVTSKSGLIGLAAGGLIVGSLSLNVKRITSVFALTPHPAGAIAAAPLQLAENQPQEYWYYFPDARNDVVMQRLLQFDATGRNPVCRILQNQYANYHFDERSDAVHINNYHVCKPDLSVMRLPTDSAELSGFIARMEGKSADMELTPASRNRLLVICKHHREHGTQIWRIDRHMNVLEEEYFQVSWPRSTPVIDDRDIMHKRGWTYIEISGHVGGHPVSGIARIPFVYAYAQQHYPWLKIRAGDGSIFVDTPSGARIYDAAGLIAAEFPGGSFFQGLLRPWTGLHCIDTIRRDAAEQRLNFATTYDGEADSVRITVQTEDLTLVYTVDLLADVIETIACNPTSKERPFSSELHLSYRQELSADEETSLVPPADVRPSSIERRQIGMRWLQRLMASQ